MSHHHLIPAWLELQLYKYHTEMASHFAFAVALFIVILLPITLAIERTVVIAFPYRHRSIMTTKTVVGMLAVMWGIAAILATVMIATEPVHINWPQALVVYHYKIFTAFCGPTININSIHSSC